MLKARLVMTDHPAWRTIDRNRVRVFATPDNDTWIAQVTDGTLDLTSLQNATAAPLSDLFLPVPGIRHGVAAQLLTELNSVAPVRRFRNPDLWDAIGTAIIRQVIRASHAKKLYRVFCEAHGERVETENQWEFNLFPTPAQTLALSDGEFALLGMTFKRRALRNAAEAFIEHGKSWQAMPPRELASALTRVKGIGPWTTGAAVADFTNDWSLYPYSDMAVRTWAARANPSTEWPSAEATFAARWKLLCGPHLSSMTLLTLAWGSHHGVNN